MPVIPQITQGLSATELKLNRTNTEAFIDANPTLVTLIPRRREKTGTGTRLVDLAARPTQRMRLIDQTRTYGPEPGSAVGADGKQRKIEYQLLGLWDAEVGLYDYWIDEMGVKYEVVDLLPDMGYERRAQVIRYGES